MDIRRSRPFVKLMRATHTETPSTQCTPVRGVPSRRSVLLARKRNAGHISLVHGADRAMAMPGDTVIFTAWITNDSTSHLRDVLLLPRSFTNEGMEMLHYTSEPAERDLRIKVLAPGQSVMRSFSYVVTDADYLHGGSLVSAMQVRATCRRDVIVDEHDAIVSLNSALPDWPFETGKASRRYSLSGSPTGISAGQSTSCS